MAAVQDIVIEQGSTFNAATTVAGNDGVPFDLTGFTSTAAIKKSYQSKVVSAVFTTAINNPTVGEVILSLTDEQTELLKAGRYRYDVFVEDALGNRYRAIEGSVLVTPAVTLR